MHHSLNAWKRFLTLQIKVSNFIPNIQTFKPLNLILLLDIYSEVSKNFIESMLVSADKAANDAVIVCRLHYICTLKQELGGTSAFKETSVEEKFVVNDHCRHLPFKFLLKRCIG